jgi:hypothetical protein
MVRLPFNGQDDKQNIVGYRIGRGLLTRWEVNGECCWSSVSE